MQPFNIFAHAVCSGAGRDRVELGHQAGLATSGIVTVHDTLGRNAVEHRDSLNNRRSCGILVARLDRKLSLFHQGAGCGTIWAIMQTATLAGANSLLGRLAISQVGPSSFQKHTVINHEPHHRILNIAKQPEGGCNEYSTKARGCTQACAHPIVVVCPVRERP